jgi:hypothetical protein
MKTNIAFILIPFFISIILTSCGPTSENARIYDDQLVDQLAKVYTKESLLIEAISKKTPEKLDGLFADFALQIDSSSANISKMGTFDGKADLRDAAVRIFDAYKDAISSDYKEIITLAKISDSIYVPEDDDKKIELCKKIDKKVNKANDEFLELEKGFRGKYKIELEVKESEKEKK